jgi:hypothetical protein
MSNNIEFSHTLPLDTEEKVKAIAVCLIQEKSEIKVKTSCISTVEQEIQNYLNVIKLLSVDYELYQVVGNDDVILFINGSKIAFIPYEMPVTITNTLTI